MGFWQNLLGAMGAGALFGGRRVATGDPPIHNQITTATTNEAHFTFNNNNTLSVATNNNLYLEPGTNLTIQSGALGGDINIRTHYDDRTMDRLFVFDNNNQTGGATDNAVTTWTNGTTTTAINDLRIAEFDYRYQQNARQQAQYLQGRINNHLDQQLDAQRYAARIQGIPQPQQRYNTANYDAALDAQARRRLDNLYQPFGGGLQGQPRHEPPNLETPRAIAEVRGQNLLKKLLGDILYRHYEKNGYVDLPSVQKPGVGFRLRAHRRIGLLKRNRLGQWIEQKESLCIHAAGGYWVEGDQVGIHYMLCQCDEKKLWKQAIVHTVAA